MSYNRTNWVDQFVNAEGVVVQQGTPVNALNLNNMEDGIEKAVSKDGGDTITGGVKFKSPTSTQKNGGNVQTIDGGMTLTSFDDISSETGNRQVLKVGTTDKSDNATALQLVRIKNGKEETFNIFHSGNKSDISPSDIGAAPSSHGTHVSFSTSAPVIDGTASAGSASTVARSDHKHPTDTSRAPKSHSSADATYGVGNNTSYGHVKLSDSTSSSSGPSDGVASTPSATKAAYDLASEAKSLAEGKAPISHGYHVPTPVTADNKKFLRNDNTWQDVTPANIGAAPASHGYHVPTPGTADNKKFLRNDNTWQDVTPANIGAVPTGRKVNGKALTGDINLSASDVSAVPTSRTINSKPLTGDISLGASDVGAASASHSHSASDVGAAPVSHGNHVPAIETANNAKFLRNDNQWATVTPSNIGAAPASHGNHVPATETADNAKFLRNDNSWQKVTPANIGAVPTSRTINSKPLTGNINLTASDVGAASASHGNHVPSTGTADNKKFLRNDNTWQDVTPANIGAVPTSRTINSKPLTGDISLGASDVGAAATSHKHSASDINSGTLSSDRLPIVPISKGGTGKTTEREAFSNLASAGAIIPLNNDVVKYYSDSDSNESAFETWLNGLLSKMSDMSSVSVVFHCNPAIGSTYYGTLSRHTADYATLIGHTYTNDLEAHVHKVKIGTWNATKFLYSELYSYGTSDLTAGSSSLATGKLYFVYE